MNAQMRTLIVNIPLPNLNFDNFSFLSAPSFTEYQRLIADPAAAATAVQQAADGEGTHTTYGGQAIVNGAASAHAFPLAELLEMRRREATRLLALGGLVVVIAHPETAVPNVAGGEWRSYSWLPPVEGFSYAGDLLPGFGRAGAVLTDAEHPFAPYIEQLAPRIAYRAHLNEDAPAVTESAAVFARSSSGVATAFQIPARGGQIVFLPALADPNKDRPAIAAAVVACLERWDHPAAAGAQDTNVAERL